MILDLDLGQQVAKNRLGLISVTSLDHDISLKLRSFVFDLILGVIGAILIGGVILIICASNFRNREIKVAKRINYCLNFSLVIPILWT